MEYGCVFVMKHRQGLSGKVLSLQQQRQGVGVGGPIHLLKGPQLLGMGQGGEEKPKGASLGLTGDLRNLESLTLTFWSLGGGSRQKQWASHEVGWCCGVGGGDTVQEAGS